MANKISQIPYSPVDRNRVSLYSTHHPIHHFFTQRGLEERTTTLFTLMTNLAHGIPQQVHSLFNRYGIDALTITPEYHAKRTHNKNDNALKPLPISGLAGVLEAAIHAESNLMEPLIINNFYYLLIDPFHFVASSQYFITFAALIVRLPLKMLIWEGIEWSSGIMMVCEVGALGAFSYFLLPIFVSFSINSHLLPRDSEAIVWTVIVGTTSLALIMMNIGRSERSKRNGAYIWAPLDLFSSSILLLFCVTFSFFNFSFCLVVAAVFVPLSILLSPLRYPASPSSTFKDNATVTPNKRSFGQNVFWLKMLLSVTVSPFSIAAIVCYYFDVSIFTLVGSMIDQHRDYATLTFPFVSTVYIPWSVSVISSLWLFRKQSRN